MKAIRRLLFNGTVLKILAVSFVLRSLIAPGLVVENSNDNPLGLTVAFCDDLATSPPDYFPDSIQPEAGGHSHHVDHSHDETVLQTQNAHSGHDHEFSHGLSNSHCGLWTASGIFLAEVHTDLSRRFLINSRVSFFPLYDTPYTRDSYYQQHHPRAPPISLII